MIPVLKDTGQAPPGKACQIVNVYPGLATRKMKEVGRSIRTTMPEIFQASQWTYSPAGLPMTRGTIIEAVIMPTKTGPAIGVQRIFPTHR